MMQSGTKAAACRAATCIALDSSARRSSCTASDAAAAMATVWLSCADCCWKVAAISASRGSTSVRYNAVAAASFRSNEGSGIWAQWCQTLPQNSGRRWAEIGWEEAGIGWEEAGIGWEEPGIGWEEDVRRYPVRLTC